MTEPSIEEFVEMSRELRNASKLGLLVDLHGAQMFHEQAVHPAYVDYMRRYGAWEKAQREGVPA